MRITSATNYQPQQLNFGGYQPIEDDIRDLIETLDPLVDDVPEPDLTIAEGMEPDTTDAESADRKDCADAANRGERLSSPLNAPHRRLSLPVVLIFKGRHCTFITVVLAIAAAALTKFAITFESTEEIDGRSKKMIK